jgi:hypothetical protein
MNPHSTMMTYMYVYSLCRGDIRQTCRKPHMPISMFLFISIYKIRKFGLQVHGFWKKCLSRHEVISVPEADSGKLVTNHGNALQTLVTHHYLFLAYSTMLSITHYMQRAMTGWLLNWKERVRKRSRPNLRYCSGTCLEVPRKTLENILGYWFRVRDFTSGLPEYRARVLPTWERRFILLVLYSCHV